MKHIGEIVNKDGLSTSKRLWIFGLALVVAIIGFACFVNALPPVDGLKCDELYAAMDLDLYQGDGSNQRPEDAARAYMSSAQAGNVDDMLLLADCYLLGFGVEVSPESAVEWYSKAIRADAQNPRALMGMALCYYMGRGIQKDGDEAVNLGYSAIVLAEDKKGDGYLSVRNNAFGLLLAACLPRQDAERPPGIWLHENLKEKATRAELFLPPGASFFGICLVVLFVICSLVEPNILDAPWQLKFEKIFHSAFVASALTIAFVCGGRANPFILITLSMVFLVYFSFSWKYILPFGVLCVWGLNLLLAYSFRSVLGISPAWNRIPQVVYNDYGNILISDDLYMSVALPDVCSAVNGTWLYMTCLVCAVLMVALRQSAAARNALASKNGKSISTSGEDAASPLVCSSSRLAVLTMVVALGAWAVGCSEREERQVSAKEEFEIPLTLVQRMMEAHDKAYSNALEVVTQPRGEMKFADDGLDEAGRTRIWPFDLESYEKELEGQMARDTNGLYRLLGRFAEGCPTDDDGLVAGGQSIRLVNLAIEAWATNQLDRIAPRMAEADYCAMFRCMGCEAKPEGTWAWEVRKNMYLVMRWVDDSLTMREYMFFQWKGAGDPYPVAMFDTFPSKKEAVAALLFKDDAASINNLAVMMWRHQCDRSSMDPLTVKSFLETARSHRSPFAAENLAVLRRHLPEVFLKKTDGPLCRGARRIRLPRRRIR